MKFYWRGLVVAAIFFAGVAVLVRAHADLLVRVAIWSFVITASVIAIARKIWSGRDGTYGFIDALPDSLRRWVRDER